MPRKHVTPGKLKRTRDEIKQAQSQFEAYVASELEILRKRVAALEARGKRQDDLFDRLTIYFKSQPDPTTRAH